MTKERLDAYEDPLSSNPEKWIKDFSIDIHCIEDLYKSYEQYKNYLRSKRNGSNLHKNL